MGRPKGSLNTKSMTMKLSLHNLNFNAIKEFVDAYKELDNARDKISALSEIFKYMYPKLKETDHTTLTIEEAEQELALNPKQMSDEELLNSLNNTPEVIDVPVRK